jgi:hypothetical protein
VLRLTARKLNRTRELKDLVGAAHAIEEAGVPAKDIDYMAPAFLRECFFFEKPPQRVEE